MKTGFVPITLEEYVELHLKSNPDTSREEITIALRGALEDYKKGAKCINCGNPIWVIGSAFAANMCFTMGLRLDAGSVAVLEERTEGWIAGLQMAALSMRDRQDVLGFIEGFSGTNRYILDYLLVEVLASQPPEMQCFLLCTSILERLTASLCDAVISDESTESREWSVENSNESRPNSVGNLSSLDSQSILEYLERANLFLVPLDDERQWYRYHHLFADLLRARLVQTCGVFSEARNVVETAQVKMWLVQGDWSAVDRWTATLEKRFGSPDPFRFEDELTYITLGRY